MQVSMQDNYYNALEELLKASVKGKNILVMGTHPDRDIKALYFRINGNMTIIEPVLSFVKEFRKNTKAKVIHADWESFNIEKFDTVVCLDCIEHSKRPYSILDRIAEASDRIILSCPNGFWNFMDGNKNVDHGHGPHVSHFSVKELKDFFKVNGFDVKIQGILHPRLMRGFLSMGIFLVATKKEDGKK